MHAASHVGYEKKRVALVSRVELGVVIVVIGLHTVALWVARAPL